MTNHQYNPQSVVVSKRFWDTLAPADRKILQEAAQESAAYQRTQSRALLQSSVEDLRKGGMEITELPPAEVAKLREKMKPVIAKHSASVGEETVKAIQAELAKLRK
jgi:TRAP-type C4-dicarboxylate transport system substrate-binding protein